MTTIPSSWSRRGDGFEGPAAFASSSGGLLGADVKEWSDGLRIAPGELQGAEIDTYDDHRMAMSLALVGLVTPGVVIREPGCTAKTYPDFFRDLASLRGEA